MRSVLRQSIIICMLALIPAIAAAVLHPRKLAWIPREGEVLLPTVRQWGPAVLWVDARPAEMYLRDRIPGAMPLNLAMWNELFPSVRDASAAGKRVVIYCDDDPCDTGHTLAERLKREAAVGEVYVLKGGFHAWKDAVRR